MLTRLKNILSPKNNLLRYQRIKSIFSKLEWIDAFILEEFRDLKIKIKEQDQKLNEVNFYLKKTLEQNEKLLQYVAANNRLIEFKAGTAKATKSNHKVAVVLPTYNRAETILRSIESLLRQTYQNYECIIVDDGSSDNTEEVISPYLSDSRFKYIKIQNSGASTARNVAIENSNSEYISFLDSDNEWMPDYLSNLMQAFESNPDAVAVYFALSLVGETNYPADILFREFNLSQLKLDNYIDLNIFALKRSAYNLAGGFDQRLTRLCDWDLILRVANIGEIKAIPVIGAKYYRDIRERVTDIHPSGSNNYFVKSKHNHLKPGAGLKVLYIISNLPELNCNYLKSELSAFARLGVELKVCQNEIIPHDNKINDTDINLNLVNLIKNFKPDIIHTNLLNTAVQLGLLLDNDISITARSLSIEDFNNNIAKAESISRIKKVYSDSSLIKLLEPERGSHKLQELSLSFDPELYYPAFKKDVKKVVASGVCAALEDYKTFISLAKKCQDYKFQLILSASPKSDSAVFEINNWIKELDSPVELITNLEDSDIAKIINEAGIYFYTSSATNETANFIPIDVLASGCYLIMKTNPTNIDLNDKYYALYENIDEAANLINSTKYWDNSDWVKVKRSNSDYAFSKFINIDVCNLLIHDWKHFSSEKEI